MEVSPDTLTAPLSGQVHIWGQHIRRDSEGRVCLNDIHAAVGSPKNQTPGEWRRLPKTTKIVDAAVKFITGFSRDKSKTDEKSVIYSKGKSGTFAHPNLAIEYAGYLSPELRVAVNDIFIRFKIADPKLADNILSRASDEDNEWVARRADKAVAVVTKPGFLREPSVAPGFSRHPANFDHAVLCYHSRLGWSSPVIG